MKKIISSKAFALGLALLLVISILGTSLVPSSQVFAESATPAVQEGGGATGTLTQAGISAADAPVQTRAAAALQAAITYVQKQDSISDWTAVSLGRTGHQLPAGYLAGLEEKVKDANGFYKKATDYARISLAVTAGGLDATDYAGYDLIGPLHSQETLLNTGINGPVYSLLAIESGAYEVPDTALRSKADLLKEIVSQQKPDGGFGLVPEIASSVDITAMVLNVLAAHGDDAEAKSAGDRAVQWLKQRQQQDGGYDSSSEATSQVIIGLTSAGIDPAGTEFTKNGQTLLDHLLAFSLPDGSFSHTLEGGSNGMATEQALQALAAYDLFLKGEKFYDFPAPTPQPQPVQVTLSIEGPQGTIAEGKAEGVTALDALKQLAAAKNIPLKITVDQQYGDYVTAINGIEAFQFGPGSGWMYLTYRDGQRISPNVGAASYALQAGETVKFYYGDYSGTSLIHSIKATPEQPQSGQAFSIAVLKDVTTYDANYVPTTTQVPAAAVKVTVAGQSVTTDESGTATFASGVAAGTHTIEVTGYQAGSFPTVLRETAPLEVLPSSTLTEVSIEGPHHTLASGAAEGVTALDALKQLTAAKNIPLEITASSFGDYVTAIDGIEAGQYGPGAGWMYLIYKDGQRIAPNVGADKYVLQAGESAKFYYGDYSGTSLIHSIKATPEQPQEGQEFTVTVLKNVTTWNGVSEVTEQKPADNVQVTAGSKSVTTDTYGLAVFPEGLAAGEYTLEVTGYVPGSYPTVLRETAPLKIKAATTPPTTQPTTPPTTSPTTQPTTQTATLQVVGDSVRGTILNTTTVALEQGDTAYSVLVRLLGSKVVSTGSGATLYVSAIDGLAEFDRGPLSGWKYKTNRDAESSDSAGIYRLQNGDNLVWYYTGETTSAPGSSTGNTSGGTQAVAITAENTTPLSQVGQTTTVVNAADKMTAAQAAELAKKLTAQSVTLEQAVAPGAASILKDAANEVQLQLPAGSVAAPVTIKVQEQSSTRKELVSGLYEFTPDGTKFLKQVELSIQVPVTTDYPQNLALAWLDTVTGQWIPVPSTLDMKSGMMTGKISHFTAYAVVDRSKWEPKQEQLKQDIANLAAYMKAAGEISDWQAIGLARSGNAVPASYLKALQEQLAANQGQFRKVTDYERLALAAAAAGLDPQKAYGYNLIERIYNNAAMTNQGSNGVIFALIALDSGAYTIPADAEWSKERLVEWLLDQQNKDGSFPLAAGEAGDVDITAMAVTALSTHLGQSKVKTAVDTALGWLSGQQLENGGYKLSGTENSESVAQVIVALSAIGAGPNDARFVKAKGGLLSSLEAYKQKDGGYAHTAGQASNGLASEQALLALAAYDRFLSGKDKLYSITSAAGLPGSTGVVFADEQQIAPWAAEAVHAAYDRKLMEGVSSSALVFAPKQNITRAQFAALLLRLTGHTAAQTSAASVFSDVKAGAWYYEEVLKAKELGFIDGVSATAFNPNGLITRQDMAVMIARAYKLELPMDVQSFKDEQKISTYAAGAVHAVAKLGYMSGFGGAFDPSAPVTREMAAVVAVRLP
ncbi:DUF4430 domain-containing protein [Paenibacillus donghaensis]|uniref:SLH domain-containing protein n=1 Tax=Paenibacillus donghaensis TaxID=414771 RepID=A0A2Z2KYY8_9BACL|nr:DUF4430 domain-containing protein [Paenibacillus donghaensis]ASA25968.1 hypothetical protein B9T62_37805 [Paenibacillus donghaensis]